MGFKDFNTSHKPSPPIDLGIKGETPFSSMRFSDFSRRVSFSSNRFRDLRLKSLKATIRPAGDDLEAGFVLRQLCDNAGFDATDLLNKLRQKHALPSGEGALYGVDINTDRIADSFANFVWEPAIVKINAINATTEVACLILSVDETVKNPKAKESSSGRRWSLCAQLGASSASLQHGSSLL